MPTTVTSTIGTGGDYSTLQAWEDACPANLVTDDKIWQGKAKNQEFSSGSNLLTVSGITTDATRYIELTTDTGASFVDNASVQTNALRYNASNGAGIKLTGAYASAVTISSALKFVMSKLQIAATGSNQSQAFNTSGVAGASGDVDKCIFEFKSNNAGGACGFSVYDSGWKIRNSLLVQRHASPNRIAQLGNGASMYNCTLVSTGGAATNGIVANYGTTTLSNVYVGNAGTVTSGSSTFSKTTSYTDTAGPPTGWSAATFSTTNFESITDGTHDFRIKTGATLKDAGTTDSTNSANDIAGTARPSGSAYDVGCWEFVASASFVSAWAIGSNQILGVATP